MNVLWNCQDIRPTEAAGVENFVYGLLSGIAANDVGDDKHVVAVLPGTIHAWKERVPPSPAIQFSELFAGDSLRARLVGHGRVRRILRGLRRHLIRLPAISWVLPRVERRARRPQRSNSQGADIAYYPFHRRLIDPGPGTVVTVHDLRVFQPEFAGVSDQATIRYNVTHASAVVASWPHPFAQLVEIFPEAVSKAYLIPLPPLLTSPPPAVTTSTPRAASRHLLLYPATTGSHKNHLRLIEAIADLSKTLDVELVCTGPLVEPWATAVRTRVRQLGLDERVRLTGFIEVHQLEGLYSAASCVVVPTLWEAASGPIFEAFARGIPVAASDIAPIQAQLAFCGGVASLFDPRDSADIARGIRRLIEDPEQFLTGARQAGKFLKQLTWSRTAAHYLEVFRWVAAGAPKNATPAL